MYYITELVIFQVPIGTMVYDEDRSLLADLDRIDSVYVAARGGAGGHGNHFYLSNENRAPMIAEQGAAGEIRKLALELRTLAHVGLVSAFSNTCTICTRAYNVYS